MKYPLECKEFRTNIDIQGRSGGGERILLGEGEEIMVMSKVIMKVSNL